MVVVFQRPAGGSSAGCPQHRQEKGEGPTAHRHLQASPTSKLPQRKASRRRPQDTRARHHAAEGEEHYTFEKAYGHSRWISQLLITGIDKWGNNVTVYSMNLSKADLILVRRCLGGTSNKPSTTRLLCCTTYWLKCNQLFLKSETLDHMKHVWTCRPTGPIPLSSVQCDTWIWLHEYVLFAP